MSRGVFIVCAFGLLLGSSGFTFAQDEEVLGKKRTEWLAILKEHKEVKFRRAAIIALEVMGPRSRGVLEGLFDALEKDADAEVRREAALTIGRMGADAKGGAESLAVALKSDKADVVREAAAHSLGKLAEQAKTQVMTLAGALKDPHAGTRAAAASTLKILGEHAQVALEQISAVAQDAKADRFPRVHCIQILGKLGGAEAVPLLLAIYEEKDVALPIKQAALESLGRLGEKAASAVRVISEGLKEKDVDLRRAAAVALAQLGEKAKEAWPAIQDAYMDADIGVRHQVIRLAGRLGKDVGAAAVTLLLEAAQKDVNVENRLAAIQELGEMQAADAAPVLTKMAQDDPRASVRDAAAAALKKIQ
ncbi:MAG: HEAT repeat domain-containing protein [Gemmataceae bacterium]|nr:HEAT repeat domain-containing protein [Gemmataceae bacterium]MCI0741931.1 HEAT repeat domain-containing protein [Gemmataceae bacterium]